MLIRVLVSLPEAASARIERLLPPNDVLLSRATRGADLATAATACDADLVLCGGGADERDWNDLVSALRGLPAQPDLIALRDREDPEERAMLITAGCLGVVDQHLADDLLAAALLSLIARKREAALLHRQRERGASHRFADFVSESPAMTKLLAVARRVCARDTSLLVLGETGVGKELLVRSMHEESPRANGPFIAVNCSALPESLLESELFGHEKGAFTGAVRAHRGYFELAHGGTLFLDEIGDMPLTLQARLLRVLQERVVRPIGSERTISVDVRVIAATNRDLHAEVRAERFREDLYYRLNVVTLEIPPLRLRHEDVPALVRNNVESFCERFSRAPLPVTPAAMDALVAYEWPGNVRELINVVERAVLLCEGDAVDVGDLPASVSGRREYQRGSIANGAWSASLRAVVDKSLAAARTEVVDAFERAYLTELLQRTHGRVGETAARAGLSQRALYTKMRQLGLRKEGFRSAPPPRGGRPSLRKPAAE